MFEKILAIRSSVGEGLSDNELTRLLRTTVLSEAGFGFLSFSNGLVTLTVPEQDLKDRYPEQGWIAPEKERIAQTLAEKYGLSLYEPVDKTTSCFHPSTGREVVRHHIELGDRRQAVIVAHPHFLKVRLLGKSPPHRYGWEALSPLAVEPEILQDVLALHRSLEPHNDWHREVTPILDMGEGRWLKELMLAPGTLAMDTETQESHQ
jgi:hypothetical protein